MIQTDFAAEIEQSEFAKKYHIDADVEVQAMIELAKEKPKELLENKTVYTHYQL